MNKSQGLFGITIGLGLLSMGIAQADEMQDTRFYIAPTVSYTLFDGAPKNELGYQLNIGKPVTQHLNLELVGNYSEPTISNNKSKFEGIGASLLYFPHRDVFSLFGLLSAQRADFTLPGSDDKGYNYDVGLGFLRQLNDYGLSYRAEYRYRYRDMDHGGHFQDNVILVGFQIPLGARPEAPPPPPPPAPPVEAPPAPPVEVPPAPPVVEVPPPAPIVLKGVNFEFDSAKLTPEAQTILNGVIDAMKGAPEVKALIKGHTCNIGTSEYNLGLSKRRAESVKSYLINGGIDGGRLETKGYGESEPVATNSTKEGRQQNRRVVLDVMDDNSCITPTVGDQVDEKGCAVKAQ